MYVTVFILLLSVMAQSGRAQDVAQEQDELVMIAVGDNLYHDVLMKAFIEDNRFDFSTYYAPVKSLVERADIAFVNQETVMGGKTFGFTGYPAFNAPQEVGEALVRVGFDVVNHATNHVMDKGAQAILATIDFWDRYPETSYLGIFHSQTIRDSKKVIIEKNHIKIGFLSYTYGLNWIPLPKDMPYLVSLIDTERMAREIDALRPLCDYLVVSMHWGEEYQFNYNARQKALSEFLAARKVDLIIGHHPHVLQPVEVLPRADGGTTQCFYSLGNFISAQIPNYTLLGGMMYLRIRKDSAGIAVVESGVIPLVTHYERGFTNFSVYPLYEYTDELAAKQLRRSSENEISIVYFTRLAEQILGGAFLKRDPYGVKFPE
jgi:poly-gamma-glutamate synthesis protein (capsule biosynthesis protein)